ncbi:transposase [Modestobacter lapidis]|nr:transposase [Modestobacter lapidis]
MTPIGCTPPELARAREEGPRGGRQSKYPEEFRQRASQLVLDSRRSVRDVAGELGNNHEKLRNWVAAERRQRADGPAALRPSEEDRGFFRIARSSSSSATLRRSRASSNRSSALVAHGRRARRCLCHRGRLGSVGGPSPGLWRPSTDC